MLCSANIHIALGDLVERLVWYSPSTTVGSGGAVQSIPYTCGYCDRYVAPDHGYYAVVTNSDGTPLGRTAQLSICPHCTKPTFFDGAGDQTPGSAFGGKVVHIPSPEVETLYDEARNCMKVNGYTAVVMCCRKLLTNIAVSEGADEGKTFAFYVRYLADEGHIPPKAAVWVDHIRDKGNEANHEINLMSREDAERLIKFSEMLLRIMYEYPEEVADPAQADA